MKRGNFSLGFLSCLLLMGITTTAYAAGIMAERSNHCILVDGQEVQMEAYVINGNNYVKLRDIGKTVGFNVYWDNEQGCVQVESSKPYTGIASEVQKNDDTVQLPTDGSQYIPQVGDVIRCNDGSNYTITDISRWDKNAFSSGPLGQLPTPNCDWSLLPQPELPDAETRHFSLESGDYLFVRNPYETRRMLYTLYNAIGENAKTWQNGKPVLCADGSSKVRIYLSIPNDQSAQNFWPWRESEIVELFDSCPAGSYYMECWDVYRNGIFQRTEYNIRTTI